MSSLELFLRDVTLTIFILSGQLAARGSLLQEDGSHWFSGASLRVGENSLGYQSTKLPVARLGGQRAFSVSASLRLFILLFQSLEGGSYRGSLKDSAGCLNEGPTPPTPTRNLEEEQKAKALRGRM